MKYHFLAGERQTAFVTVVNGEIGCVFERGKLYETYRVYMSFWRIVFCFIWL